MLKSIEAGVLSVAYEESGPASGPDVVLLHGFPYDIRSFDEVTERLVAEGCHVVSPYLRGYGSTQFLSTETPRSGQQASLADDLLSLLDAMKIEKPVLAGYDWGGRAACIVAALSPDRVRGLVSGGGYNVHDIEGSIDPIVPELERRMWYQYYFHSERGRAGLEEYRYELCKLLWQTWSPSWKFDDATYDRTVASFANPDFVAVVIHSYRHRYGLVAGDPAVEEIERRLAAKPTINVPTVVLHGDDDGVMPAKISESHSRFFGAEYERIVVPGGGHNLPQEKPQEFAAAVMSLI